MGFYRASQRLGRGESDGHRATRPESTSTLAMESTTRGTAAAAFSSSPSSASSRQQQPNVRLGRLSTIGLLLTSASTVVYQGMQQRSLTRSMENRLEGRTTSTHLDDLSASVVVDSRRTNQSTSTASPPRNASSSSSSSSPPASIVDDVDTNWLGMADFYVYLDAFSDSWYMNTELFLNSKQKMDEIDGVEEACFLMFDGKEDKVRMSLDWLDLSVEHMSKWWRTVGAPQNEYANRRVVAYFTEYSATHLKGAAAEEYEPYRALLRPTVAVVAFQEYAEPGSRHNEQLNRRSRDLTLASLAATISSLVQVGMGRIVVVGHDQNRAREEPQIMEAFELLAARANETSSAGEAATSGNERVVRGSQLAYVTVPTDMVRTDFIQVNVPRGALLGLHYAFTGNNHSWTRAWLGEDTLNPLKPPESMWKFVYLTEPDTFLHTRPRTVATLARMLHDGYVLAPHRLQPIPYQSDFPNSTAWHTLLGEAQVSSSPNPTIATLDANTHACCDDQRGVYRPGSHQAVGSNCGDFWWLCGFNNEITGEEEKFGNHSRILDNYHLMRLRQGTGVTTLAGSEHGRRCIPVANGVCQRMARNRTNVVRRPRNPWVTPNKQKQRRIAQVARELNATTVLRGANVRS